MRPVERLIVLAGSAACAYFGWRIGSMLFGHEVGLRHVHDHQHGAEAALEDLNRRVEVLEDRRKRKMGPEEAASTPA